MRGNEHERSIMLPDDSQEKMPYVSNHFCVLPRTLPSPVHSTTHADDLPHVSGPRPRVVGSPMANGRGHPQRPMGHQTPSITNPCDSHTSIVEAKRQSVVVPKSQHVSLRRRHALGRTSNTRYSVDTARQLGQHTFLRCVVWSSLASELMYIYIYIYIYSPVLRTTHDR